MSIATLEPETKQQEFRVKGYIPVALYSDAATRQLFVSFENDNTQAVGHETAWAWRSTIERWSEGRAW